jgi:DNA-binding transcriptional ArsR family regulator
MKILANENRLLILCALIKEPLTVHKIAEYVPRISQPALSQHLMMLKNAGILSSEKEGQNVIYSIADHRVTEVLGVFKKYYCE